MLLLSFEETGLEGRKEEGTNVSDDINFSIMKISESSYKRSTREPRVVKRQRFANLGTFYT